MMKIAVNHVSIIFIILLLGCDQAASEQAKPEYPQTPDAAADGSGCTTRLAGYKPGDLDALIAATDVDCWDSQGSWIGQP
jgi:hypothetical protein